MRSTELFDDHQNGLMSEAERRDFETRLGNEPILKKAYEEHLQMIQTLKMTASRNQLKQQLKDVHAESFGGDARLFSMKGQETFAKKHGKTIAVAASTALIAVLSTVAALSTGGYLLKQQSNQITDLNRVVMELQASNTAIVEGITRNNKKIAYAPANLEGSAFALNNKGYILTSFHMVKNADSIFIQNKNTERTLAKLIMSDAKLDLAVLKIENQELIQNWQVPFGIKDKVTDIGEKVFTLGYPRNEMVYGEGSISSLSGYSNDTSMYQISIPVNPGNSGGPVLDEYGNIIGVIRGKISGAEATGFAIKAAEIIQSINALASDCTKKDLSLQASKRTALKNLKRSEQIKRINPYVFNVLVYKKD